ncbi:DUF6931 family protein [Jannaschia sp. LMIT008]|uniref:DUF6931 family protein n=1 Tax=Jannaschia maritima TaxID=3032585 RepID=UPI002811F207|nr:hypothetical protein [Jannaschia sp. LMIT008]
MRPAPREAAIDVEDKTRPPVDALRYRMPRDLYAALPELAELTQHRPRGEEDAQAYLARLRSSTTPEDAVTFTAFAAVPHMAIWWGYESLRELPQAVGPRDRDLMGLVAAWTSTPTDDLRHRTMQRALFAPARSPAVMLGLAVGWSGGSIAPMDTAPVPPARAPRSIASAILSALARAPSGRRSVHLAGVIAVAETICRGA